MPTSSVTRSSGTLDAVIQQLMALERRRLDGFIQQRGDIQLQQSTLSEITSKLSALQTKASSLAGLQGFSPLYKFSATTADADKVTATAGAGALAGSYAVEVNQLAAAHAMASNEYTKTATTFTPGSYTFNVTVGSTTVPISVTVASGDDDEAVLGNVASALNDSSLEVIASVVTTDDTAGKAKLVLRSKDTGTANAIGSITDVTGNLAATLNLTQTQAAADALLVVDGVSITSSSNTVEGAVPGVTLTLVSKTNDQGATPVPVAIDVAGDTAGIESALKDFITVYNEAVSTVRAQVLGDFRGDPIIAALPRQLSGAVSTAVSGLGAGNPSTLLELGITINADGTLALSNTNRLHEAIKEHGVGRLAVIFNDSSEGIGTQLETLLDKTLGGPQTVISPTTGQPILDGEGNPLMVSGTIKLIEDQLTQRTRRINDRIDLEEERLAKREVALRQQYARLQDLISGLSLQSSVSDGIFSSIYGG